MEHLRPEYLHVQGSILSLPFAVFGESGLVGLREELLGGSSFGSGLQRVFKKQVKKKLSFVLNPLFFKKPPPKQAVDLVCHYSYMEAPLGNPKGPNPRNFALNPSPKP